jgi:hypothetical protein
MIMRKRGYGYGLEVVSSGKISFWIYNAAATKSMATSPNAYNNDQWHHAVGVYDGSTVKLYIDGSQVASANAGTISYGAGGIAIGRDGDYSGAYFNGLIDNLSIYNRALSGQEVQELYNAFATSSTTALTGSMISSHHVEDYINVIPKVTATPKPPTVTLQSFKAETGSDGRIIITWETAKEINHAGFNLYRSRLRNGTYTQINNALINAKGNTGTVSRYQFVDQPGRGNFYYYKLESINYNGISAMHGTVKVRVKR